MQDEQFAKRLGEYLRSLREALPGRPSQEEFAELCGLHRTYIGLIERGERAITIETGRKVAKALGVKLSDVLRKIGG